MKRPANPREAFCGLSCDYERHRPDYPPEIIAWTVQRLGLAAGDRVADAGAGTGILTRRLEAAGLRPIALDLSREMLLRQRPTTAPLAMAEASALPLRVASVRAVFAAQAFHWFDPTPTLREWHRVLGRGGGVALLWNDRDRECSEFVRECDALIVQHNSDHRLGYRELPVEALLSESGLFTGACTEIAEHRMETTPDGLIGFFRSVSYVANTLSREEMVQFESQLREMMALHFPSGEVIIPLRCRATVARRRDEPR